MLTSDNGLRKIVIRHEFSDHDYYYATTKISPQSLHIDQVKSKRIGRREASAQSPSPWICPCTYNNTNKKCSHIARRNAFGEFQ